MMVSSMCHLGQKDTHVLSGMQITTGLHEMCCIKETFGGLEAGGSADTFSAAQVSSFVQSPSGNAPRNSNLC